MKVKLLIVVCAVLALFGLGQAADSIHVSLYDVDRARYLDPGVDTVYFNSSSPGTHQYQWRFGFENDVRLVSMSLGFRFYTEDPSDNVIMNLYDNGNYGNSGAAEVIDGSRMNPATDTVQWDFGSALYCTEVNVNNGLPDSILFGGQGATKGLQAGPMEDMIALHFTLDGLAYNEEATMCIDSATIPGGGDWLFLRDDWVTIVKPGVNTPICFLVTDPSFESADPVATPFVYSLSQNYPNPFNPRTRIDYSLERKGNVNISVFNILGQKVKTLVDAELDAGEYTAFWNGDDESGNEVASGIYFYKLTTGDFVETRKMALMR